MAISIGDALLKLGVDTKDFDKGMKGLGASIKKHSKQIRLAGLAMAGFGVAIGVVAVKSAAAFDKGMREVNSLLGLSEKEFQALSKETLELSKSLGVDAVESTKALYQAISAGIPRENALTFMKVASKAAIAGVTDTETAVDGLTTAMNAWKIQTEDAEKVADSMFSAVKLGKTTFAELSDSMSKAGPIAAAMGVSLDSVLAAAASLTKQGFPTASAMTGIRQVMVALAKPTEDMADLLQKMGFESGTAALEALGFQGTLEALTTASEGNQETLAKALGSVEALGAALGLTGANALGARSDLNEVTGAAGSMSAAFTEMDKSSSRQFARLKADIQATTILLGVALKPALVRMIDTITPLVKSLSLWIEAHGKLSANSLILITSLGGVLIVLPSLVKGIQAVIITVRALGVVMATSLGPIGLIVMAIGFLALAWINDWGKMREATATIINAIVKSVFWFVDKVIG
ncbi:hypothetical protein LCGC14_1915580, partial [marine sediment metagenome]